MSTAEYSFRSAAIGGFHRQDVLDYIESSAHVQREKLTTLKKETASAEKHRALAEMSATKSRAKVVQLTGEVAQLTGEVGRLTATLVEKSAALELAEGELSREKAEHIKIRAQLGALLENAAKMEAGAKAYEELKDRTATIELEARQRASTIEREAEERVGAMRLASKQLLNRIQSGYERLREDMDATISHATSELGQVDKALESVKAEFSEHDATLESLMRSYQECDSMKIRTLPPTNKEE